MKRLNISRTIVYIVFGVSLLFLSSCSGTSGSQEAYGQGTGSIAFSIQLPTGPVFADGTGSMYKAAQLDCDRLGIVTVEAIVYDENDNVIAQGGPWECNAGEGIIYGVPAGNNRTVLIFLKDEDHIIQYSGNKSEIQVFAGRTTDAGTIIVIEGEEEDNHLPLAVDDSASVVRGEMVQGNVLENDLDEDGDRLSASLVTEPGYGSVSLDEDGTFIYTHDGSEADSDSFTYEVTDGRGGSATAVVNITILPDPFDNNAPVAVDDSANVVRGGRVQGNVLENDYDEDGDTLDAFLAGEPGYGTVSLNEDGTFLYIHNGSSESSNDSFTYDVTDGRGGSATATVSIFILLDPQDNHSPVLTDGKVTPGAGQTTEIFTYTLHYSDIDGHAASDRNVVIDGYPYAMKLSRGSPWEGTYTYQTTLDPGEHDYYFDFSDGYEGTARLPEAKTFYGPHVALAAYFVAPPPYGDDENVGSAVEPFATIGHAIEITQGEESNPVTIYVSVGIFEENLDLDAWETLMGGWSVDFSQRWDFANNGSDPTEEYKTVLDGGGIERCMSIIEVDGVVIDGMTMFNGRSTSSDTGGSGIYISTCSPVIINCSMLNNSNALDQPYGYGGGIYCYASDPIISNCIFSQNSAIGAFSYGGGMYNYHSDPVITNCVFIQNNASGISFSAGGAICNNMSNPIITNCTFSLNVSSSEHSKAGGICNISSAPVITNSILWGDTAMKGSEIYGICETECEITFCDIDQALSVNDRIHDNIRQNPLFVDPSSGDLHIDDFSPCIDAGTNNAPWLLETDFDGDPRIINGDVDMGADEFVQ